MNELYITDKDKHENDIEIFKSEIDFKLINKTIHHWSGDIIQYDDGLPVGVL